MFYWRTHTLNPWQWLFLEMLLKRTKAEMVERVYPSLISKYHSPRTIIQTSSTELADDLRSLGLYKQRCAAFKLIAEFLVISCDGKVPTDQTLLVSLPHVGQYTANAMLCFCFGQRKPVVDVNVARILTRVCGTDMPTDARSDRLSKLAEGMLPEHGWKEYNYGLLDLGASICKNRKPGCSKCFASDLCSYASSGNKQG